MPSHSNRTPTQAPVGGSTGGAQSATKGAAVNTEALRAGSVDPKALSESGLDNSFVQSLAAGGESATESKPRPTTLRFAYNQKAMELAARQSPSCASALTRIMEFGMEGLQDGDALTDEQKLCIVYEALRGESSEDRENIIAAVFFGDINKNVNVDHVSELIGGGGGVTVKFWNDVGATIEAMSFSAPVAYPGLDTNRRQQQVESARGMFTIEGNRVAYSGDTFVNSKLVEIEADFVRSRHGLSFQATPPAARRSTPGYREALNDYIYEVVLNGRSAKIAAQCEGLLDAWRTSNPPPSPMTAAWAQSLALQAMTLVTGYTNSNLYAEPHNHWRIEDEAAAALLVERLYPNLKANYDTDGNTVVVTGLR